MLAAQLEMSFESRAVRCSPQKRRLSRARWWFQRMRQLVDSAIDWQPAPPARPEQMWLAASGLRLPVVEGTTRAKSTSEESQICA